MSKTLRKTVGILGEELAARYLEGRGFEIVSRNYLRPWGEIDIIAKNKGILHFIEVKTIRSEGAEKTFRPEENAHSEKLRKVARTAESYLHERRVPKDAAWQLDVVAVRLDFIRKEAKIRYIEQVSLSDR